MKIKWNEEMVLRCSVEDKLPSELIKQSEQPATSYETVLANLQNTEIDIQ